MYTGLGTDKLEYITTRFGLFTSWLSQAEKSYLISQFSVNFDAKGIAVDAELRKLQTVIVTPVPAAYLNVQKKVHDFLTTLWESGYGVPPPPIAPPAETPPGAPPKLDISTGISKTGILLVAIGGAVVYLLLKKK